MITMHETVAELKALQRLLDESHNAAGAHLGSVHGDGRRLSAEEVCTKLSGITIVDLATVNSAHAPFVAPVDGLFF